MTVLEIKSDLHKLIDKIDDINILKSILLILNRIIGKKDEDFWDLLSEDEKESVAKGLAQAKEGELISNEDVLREVKQKYGL